MKIAPLTIAAAALIALAGCQEPEAPQPTPALKQQAAAPAPPLANEAHPAPGEMPGAPAGMAGGSGPMSGSAPMGGGPGMPASGATMTAEDALKIVTTIDPGLAPQQAAMQKAEAAYTKSPNDAKLKTAYVNATYAFGHAVMLDGQKDQRVMYRAALALYRRALKVDPKHQPSLDDKKLIEGIYVSMGRPIPK